MPTPRLRLQQVPRGPKTVSYPPKRVPPDEFSPHLALHDALQKLSAGRDALLITARTSHAKAPLYAPLIALAYATIRSVVSTLANVSIAMQKGQNPESLIAPGSGIEAHVYEQVLQDLYAKSKADHQLWGDDPYPAWRSELMQAARTKLGQEVHQE
jgi:hypothetical protein